jgi:hypothetical protein
MNTNERIVVAVFSLALAALLLIPLTAMARAVANVRIPVSGVVFNPCNGETVTFNGIDHFTATVTLDGAGGFHTTAHDNVHVTATGSLGNSYEGNQEDNFEFNGRVGVEQTFGLTFSEISRGSAPNFEMHILQHVTVNANGTVTAFLDNITSNCRG